MLTKTYNLRQVSDQKKIVLRTIIDQDHTIKTYNTAYSRRWNLTPRVFNFLDITIDSIHSVFLL